MSTMEVAFDVADFVTALEEGDVTKAFPCRVDGREGDLTIDGDGSAYYFGFLIPDGEEEPEEIEESLYEKIMEAIDKAVEAYQEAKIDLAKAEQNLLEILENHERNKRD
jgi:hypothetical protein